MKRFLLFAGAALAAVAFSPGPEVALALGVLVLTVALGVLAVPWLNTFLTSSITDDRLTGHGHINLRAVGLGAGGRHGPPRGIVVLVVMGIFWAVILSTWRRLGHAVMSLATSAGHALARTNTAAQPLPS